MARRLARGRCGIEAPQVRGGACRPGVSTPSWCRLIGPRLGKLNSYQSNATGLVFFWGPELGARSRCIFAVAAGEVRSEMQDSGREREKREGVWLLYAPTEVRAAREHEQEGSPECSP